MSSGLGVWFFVGWLLWLFCLICCLGLVLIIWCWVYLLGLFGWLDFGLLGSFGLGISVAGVASPVVCGLWLVGWFVV